MLLFLLHLCMAQVSVPWTFLKNTSRRQGRACAGHTGLSWAPSCCAQQGRATAQGWDVGKRAGRKFCTSASFSAAAPGVDTAQAYGTHPMTHPRAGCLLGETGTDSLLLPAVMHALRKALLAPGWCISGLFYYTKRL